MKNRQSTTKYSMDEMTWNTMHHILRDFRTNANDPTMFSELTSHLLDHSVSGLRNWCNGEVSATDAYAYKVEYQLKNFVKRYRFRKDLYTDDELRKKAIDDFLATQTRLSSLSFDNLSHVERLVVKAAKKYIRQILGKYRDDEHRALCRFGKKASVGIPARKACEAERWELPITGSAEQISWFHSEMSGYCCVQDYWNQQMESDPEKRSLYREVSCLKLALVPKTFKAFRSIMPNTTIGSYMSYGIGEMIRLRLKRGGYDIRKLQHQHRNMAMSASITNCETTMDLSSASDSITDELVKLLLPADWYEILARSRISCVELPDGTIIESKTFCTMGIGYTFPLQTLIFLGLLKGLSRVCHWHTPCTISVYGDDMIFSSSLFPVVLPFFPKMGFVINFDKTYDEGGFRESCGGDYYHGVDVRPFQPQNGQAFVDRKVYEAHLYKYINGLLRRWTEYEVRGTLEYLLSELARVTRGPKLVPGDFPDDSGIRCKTLDFHAFLRGKRYERPKRVGHGLFRFSYLRFKSKEREETRHEPYLWLALRPRLVGEPSGFLYHTWEEPDRSHVLDLIEISTGVSITPIPILINRVLGPTRTFRSKLTGTRLSRVATFIGLPGEGTYTRQSGTSCFDGRS